MKRVQLFVGCDMTYAQTGTMTPASETVYVAIGPDPDHLIVHEVDLTADWAGELRSRIQPFLDAGHAPGELDAPGGTGGKSGSRYTRPGMGSQEAVAHNQGMRAWADATGFTHKDGPGYRQINGGGYYYTSALRKAYAAHLGRLAGLPADQDDGQAGRLEQAIGVLS